MTKDRPKEPKDRASFEEIMRRYFPPEKYPHLWTPQPKDLNRGD